MGWFLWGVLLGWGACTVFAYSQRSKDTDTAADGAWVVFVLIGIAAILISIGFGMAGGVIGPATPTPLLGR